jgi:hypothetical protein
LIRTAVREALGMSSGPSDQDPADAPPGGEPAATYGAAEEASGPRIEITFEDGQRVVRVHRRAPDGSTWIEEQRFPAVLAHLYPPRGPGEQIPLYAGDFHAGAGAGPDQAPFTGGVFLQWYPNPHVVAAGVRAEADITSLNPDAKAGWFLLPSVVLPDLTGAIVAPAAPINEPTLGNGMNQSTRQEVQQELGSREGLDRLTFLIPNGWNVWHGDLNINDPAAPGPYWPGRIVANAGDWRVTIDRRREAGDALWKGLRNTGQSAVTHIGQVERVDGARFDVEKVTPVLQALRLALSIAVGRAVALLLPVGWQGGSATWARWMPDRIDSVREVGAFLDASKGHAQLRELIERVLSYCDSEDRRDVLQYATSYYITATYDVDVEMRVALPISGLQLLAYRRFVEEQQKYTNADWANLSKSDPLDRGNTELEIRALLDDCKASTAIPAHFRHLQAVSASLPPLKNKSLRDALGTVVNMRNKIIHPTKGRPSRWTGVQWWEAGAFATNALLLSILNTVGYEGVYRSPLQSVVFTGAVNRVPWAPPGPPGTSRGP